MACRCQERLEAIKRAVASRSASEAVKAARFVLKTASEDAGRALVRKVRRK